MDGKHYGWIPILSGELIIRGYFFQDVSLTDIKDLFNSTDKQVLLSDKWFDTLFRLKHIVSFNNIKFVNCDECGGKLLHLSVRVSNWRGEKLLEGEAEIHGNGLAQYKVEKTVLKPPSPERVMHKLVRDVFHTHTHHSSDLPLPPIIAENEDEGKKKILKEYVKKFIHYKKMTGKTKIKDALEDLSRARGEIVYAQSAYEIFEVSNNDFSYLSIFRSFDYSFRVLSERLSLRLRLATSYILLAFTSLLIAVGLYQASISDGLWLITVGKYEIELLCLLSFAPLSIFLYYILETVLERQK